jgi:hypothetical protein
VGVGWTAPHSILPFVLVECWSQMINWQSWQWMAGKHSKSEHEIFLTSMDTFYCCGWDSFSSVNYYGSGS